MILHKLYKAGTRVLSLSRWRNRLIFWCGAIVVGVIAAGYAFIADYAQALFAGMVDYSALSPLVISPLVFGLGAWLTARYSPGAIGSGIPQAIAARELQDPAERHYLLGLQNIAGKILFTALGLLGGASIGREGPTVQIGAAILYMGARLGNVSEKVSRSLILAGAAAGVAAAFNTPLAGIVFAIEEMAREFEHRYSGVVLTAIVLAGSSSLSILGNYTYFGIADGHFAIGRDWLAILVMGAFGGLLGGVFSRLLIDGGPWFYALCKRRNLHHPELIAALCGFAIALLGLITQGTTYGSGYVQAKSLLDGHGPDSWTFTVGKFFATAISGLSGLPGGIFSPSLSVGAGFGASMASWFSATPTAGVVLLGMTAYFAGVTQAPITSFIIVLEITGGQSLPVPLIAASVIAVALSRLVCPVSLYHALAQTFIAKAKRPELEHQ
jgi:H+/Cl- antiporter ClcA